MTVRPYKWQLDAININEIWKKHHDADFSVPGLNNVVTNLVIYDGSKLVAFGMVKLFAEAILVMDLDANKRDRANALKVLFTEAFSGCQKAGIEQLHVSVTNPDFAELLKKHYDFKETEGQILVVEV
jgi:hypothetical protein